MSQNRQSEKDRLHARLDYEVNLKAEVEILALHEKLDELRDRAWRELLEMQQRQLALLEFNVTETVGLAGNNGLGMVADVVTVWPPLLTTTS